LKICTRQHKVVMEGGGRFMLSVSVWDGKKLNTTKPCIVVHHHTTVH